MEGGPCAGPWRLGSTLERGGGTLEGEVGTPEKVNGTLEEEEGTPEKAKGTLEEEAETPGQ